MQLCKQIPDDEINTLLQDFKFPQYVIIGQDRAERSLTQGLHIKVHRFNVYVAGLTGKGKLTIVKNNQFKIWAVDAIAVGMEVLTCSC